MNGSLALADLVGARVTSLNFVDEVLTVRRIDSGLREEATAGPRETVAVATLSARRDLEGLDGGGDSESASANDSEAFAAAHRWLRRAGMTDEI